MNRVPFHWNSRSTKQAVEGSSPSTRVPPTVPPLFRDSSGFKAPVPETHAQAETPPRIPQTGGRELLWTDRDHHLVSTGSTLQFVLDGQVPTISAHYLAAARTWFKPRVRRTSGLIASSDSGPVLEIVAYGSKIRFARQPRSREQV